MNIDDVKNEIEVPEDIFADIFKRQHDLAVKYRVIEIKNGFWCPNLDDVEHIDSAQLQNWIKNMFWRTTEEIAEALEKIPLCIQNSMVLTRDDWVRDWDKDPDLRHFFEEMADALHFLVEVSLTVELNPSILSNMWNTLNGCDDRLATRHVTSMSSRVVYAMGLAANTLKNKPWKNTQMTTDFSKFMAKLELTWKYFIELWKWLECTLPDIYQLYVKKSMVNKFRQDSNY